MMGVHEDAELSRLVERYVLHRECAGLSPEWEPDNLEGGLTDYPYVDEGQPASELIGVGAEIGRLAAGRKIWLTKDGVGIRVFFGELHEVKERLRRMWEELKIREVLES